MDPLPPNQDALNRRHPALAERLRLTQAGGSVRVQPARSGVTLVWERPQGPVFLHSRVDPVREAQRWAGSLAPADEAVIIGHGAGHIVRAARGKAGRLWVLAEPRLLCLALEHFDWSDLLLDPGIRWILIEPGRAEFQEELRRLPAAAALFLHRPFVDYVCAVIPAVQPILEKIISGRETEDELRPIAAANLRANRDALDAPGIRVLEGLAGGRTAVVAAAGPSLDRAADAIRRLHPRSVLIAVDTVAAGLASIGCEPDFTVSIDPRGASAGHFSGDRLPRSILIFTPLSCPAVVARFNGRRALAVPRGHFWLEPARPLLERKGMLDSGGSVSILAAAFGLHLRPSRLVLAGMDMQTDGSTYYSRLAAPITAAQAGADRFQTVEQAADAVNRREVRDGRAPRLEHYTRDLERLLKANLSQVCALIRPPAGTDSLAVLSDADIADLECAPALARPLAPNLPGDPIDWPSLARALGIDP